MYLKLNDIEGGYVLYAKIRTKNIEGHGTSNKVRIVDDKQLIVT